MRLRKGFPRPPFTMIEFNQIIDDFERNHLETIRSELSKPHLARRLKIERRPLGVDLTGGIKDPIGSIRLVEEGLTFVPELIEGRDWTHSNWLTPNEVGRWLRQAWESQVRE